MGMPDIFQSFMGAYNQAKDRTRQKELDAQADEERQLKMDALKHTISQMKLEDRLKALTTSRGAAVEQAQAQQGQDAPLTSYGKAMGDPSALTPDLRNILANRTSTLMGANGIESNPVSTPTVLPPTQQKVAPVQVPGDSITGASGEVYNIPGYRIPIINKEEVGEKTLADSLRAIRLKAMGVGQESESKAAAEYPYKASEAQIKANIDAAKTKDQNAFTAAENEKNRKSREKAAALGKVDLPNVDFVGDPESTGITSQLGIDLNTFYALTGQNSKLSRDAITRAKANTNATKLARDRGIDVSTLASQYDIQNKVLASNISRMNNTKIMENEVQGTVDNLKGVVDEANMGKVNAANVAKIWLGQNVNDPLAQQYALHLSQLRNELAAYYAATQGRSGSAILESDQRDAANVIKNGISSGSLAGLSKAIESSTGKMDGIMQDSVHRARKSVWDLFGVGQNYKGDKKSTQAPSKPTIKIISVN